MSARDTRGFTLIEVLIAVVIVGILVNIAIPATQEIKWRAQGAAVTGSVNAIEVAAFDYYAKNGSFPGTRFGSIPTGLEESLPTGFSFTDSETQTVFGWITIDFPGIKIIGTIVQNPLPPLLERVVQGHSGPVMGSAQGGLVILLTE